MTHILPVTHSILEATALVAAVWPDYALPEPLTCSFLSFGLNDHYMITTAHGDFVLRVYHHGWRTDEDIAYEIAAITHLHQRGAPVCAPLVRRDGRYAGSIVALEGPRTVVLFPYAVGHEPDETKEDDFRAYGRALAMIHRHSDDFTSSSKRFSLDLAHLLDQPLAHIQPFLHHRPADMAFIQTVAREVRAGLAQQIDGLEWGFCHGDFHGGNAHVDGAGEAWVFDFDCCGPGCRAYDLAVCRWGNGKSDTAWTAFCRGYEEIRPISETFRQSIPWFIVARQLWLIGLHAAFFPHTYGVVNLDDGYFNLYLNGLRKLIEQHLPELVAANG